jgi:membrane protease YdiL (CAAX protease family)
VKNLSRFFLFFLFCALVAAVMSPWIYLLIQEAAKLWNGTWVWTYLAKHSFHRYFTRVLQVSLVLGIFGLLKKSGFRNFRDLGFKRENCFKYLITGIASSVLILGCFLLTLHLLGIGWQSKTPPENVDWIVLLPKIALTATVVSILEEIFFRGYFFQLSKRAMGYARAVMLNALFFSLLHYVKPSTPNGFGPVDWKSGFAMLGLAFQRFLDPSAILPGLLVLMLIAWILCWAFEKTGSLSLAIGCHAGWILVQQFASALPTSASSFPTWILGGGNLSQGMLVMLPLTLQFLLLRYYLRDRNTRIR